jgi:phosphoribosyl 1,2-cyclic phosphodiesterase
VSTLSATVSERSLTGASDFGVTFWGVRGSIASPGPHSVRYGGNTLCVELRCGPYVLVLDAGTGLRPLGSALADRGTAEIDLFLGHTHMDHIEGLPFFGPLFRDGTTVRLWAGHLLPETTLRAVCERLMSPPLFPVPPAVFRARVEYRDFRAGETLEPRPGLRIVTRPLDHPNGCTGYRVEYAGRAVAYVTDTNHRPGTLDPNVLALIERADLVVYDAMFTETEHAERPEWGHSTWRQGVALAAAADAGRLALIHHDPARTDDELDAISAEAASARPGTLVAYEGLTLAL